PRPRQTTTRRPMIRGEEILLKRNPMAVKEGRNPTKEEVVVVKLEVIGVVSSADYRVTVSLSARRMTESV
ncbi:hypothetical protein A2U01_0104570, partial [Trifolium medium]|nr:hypothetical protein [Trifolium medium]